MFNRDAKILFINDFPRNNNNYEELGESQKEILINALNAAGILASDYCFISIHNSKPAGGKLSGFSRDEKLIAQGKTKLLILESKANVIVPLGEYALGFLTGLQGIYKQHLSVLSAKAEFGFKKVIPFLHPETVIKSYADVAYIRYGCVKLKREMMSAALNIPERKFLLSLDLSPDEQIAYLESILKNASEVSTDVETSKAGINTIGFAISPTEAISVQTEQAIPPESKEKIWELVSAIWKSENIGKIAQNALFEATWAHHYKTSLNNVTFDTMMAMRFLHPTLERGLDNVGRIYTPFPYWKDDHSDWNNIRNWRDHLSYNCKDTTGQFAAAIKMREALGSRLNYFNQVIMKNYELSKDMMIHGIKLDLDKVSELKIKAEEEVKILKADFSLQCKQLLNKEINLNSPKQVKELLKAVGVKLPTVGGKETSSKSALLKLRTKYPKVHIIKDIIRIDDLVQKNEEYLNFNFDEDQRVRCSFDSSHSEDGVWHGRKTIFDTGFDLTKTPSVVRQCLIADEGKTLFEIKVDQPEIRFLAIDSLDEKMNELIQKRESLGKYIAARFYNKTEEFINPAQERLGFIAIKSSAYFESPRQFIEKAFARSQISLNPIEAKRIMDLVLQEFPGIRKRIDKVKKQLYSTRTISYRDHQITYYDRINDSLLRKALAWAPNNYAQRRTLHFALAVKYSSQMQILALGKEFCLVQGVQSDLNELLHLKTDDNKIGFGDKWSRMSYV